MSHFKFINSSMAPVRQKCYELLKNNAIGFFSFPALVYALGVWRIENSAVLLIVANLVAIKQFYFKKFLKKNSSFFLENTLLCSLLLLTLLYNMVYRPVEVQTQESLFQEYQQLAKINDDINILSQEVDMYYDYNSARDTLEELYNLILMYQNTQDIVVYDKYDSLKPSILVINAKINDLKVPLSNYFAAHSNQFLWALNATKSIHYRYKRFVGDNTGRHYFKISDNKIMFIDEYAKRIDSAEKFLAKPYELSDVESKLNMRIQPLLFIIIIVGFVLTNGVIEYRRKKKFNLAFL